MAVKMAAVKIAYSAPLSHVQEADVGNEDRHVFKCADVTFKQKG